MCTTHHFAWVLSIMSVTKLIKQIIKVAYPGFYEYSSPDTNNLSTGYQFDVSLLSFALRR